MSNYILVINPGSTSTKIGVFENDTLLFDKTLRHPAEEIAKYNNWNDLSAAINKAETTRKALEAEGLKAGLTQAEMDKMTLAELQKAVDKAKNKVEIDKTMEAIKVLNPGATGEGGKPLTDMTLDELKALLSALQQERAALEAAARSAGMSNEEIKKYPTNAALQQAVNEKTKAQREALINEILAMEGAPPKSELQNKTLDELKAIKAQLDQRAALIAEIKALAATVNVTVTDQELAAMSLEQLAAKKQELANQKQLMNEIIAKIRELKSDYDPTGKTLEQLQQDLADLQQNQPTPPTPPTPGGEGGEGGSGEGGGKGGGEGGGTNPAASGTSGEGTTA